MQCTEKEGRWLPWSSMKVRACENNTFRVFDWYITAEEALQKGNISKEMYERLQAKNIPTPYVADIQTDEVPLLDLYF